MRSTTGCRALALAPVFAVLMMVTLGRAKHLGQVGRVYPIAEPDALAEIEERAAKIDWEEVLPEEKRQALVVDYRPQDMAPLPRAQEGRTRLVDMTYTLEIDLPDGKGGVLYPKGFTFDPLEYVFYPNVLVFLDGDDPEQVAWFETSPLARDPRVRVILTGGNWSGVSARLGRPAFYLSGPLRQRFRLEAVPSVVWQAGGRMEVKEIDVRNAKRRQSEASP